MSTLPVIQKAPRLRPLRLGGPRPFPLDRPQSWLTRNGRTAIRAGLRAMNIPQGARILMPAWHCGSEIDAVLAAGGVPELYRLDDDFQADLDDLEARLKAGPAWAVYLTHYFGYRQPVERALALARSHGAHLIEDVALGLFSTDATGTPLGQSGDMAVYSLVKTLPVPDGGALWLADPALVPAPLANAPMRKTLGGLKSILRRGKRRSGPVRDPFQGTDSAALDAWEPSTGIDRNSPDCTASPVTRLLLRCLDHDRIAAAHRANYRALYDALPQSDKLRPLLPPMPDGACPVIFPLYAEDSAAACAALAAAGVEPVRFWRRFHPDLDLGEHPRITRIKRHTIRLPVHIDVDKAAIERMAAALRPLA